ncbi:uncharacterized protein si:dkeyp-55f12.3 [Trematomus bernacchii]|uniref:uncharacterized protein si:dkeyp-55f12.3 n=1 Tax=Trematomus bernacchii TaxID=40690 RepID=UPI00146C8D1A|nr:uncharacterized protein si:dkeyp-55f12.3 [Trematomus bernacchii]
MFAELRFRDGQKEKLSVKVEPDLSSVISGVQELRSTVKILLSGLVEQERAGAGGEEEEEQEESDEGDKGLQKARLQPPAKKSKNT